MLLSVQQKYILEILRQVEKQDEARDGGDAGETEE